MNSTILARYSLIQLQTFGLVFNSLSPEGPQCFRQAGGRGLRVSLLFFFYGSQKLKPFNSASVIPLLSHGPPESSAIILSRSPNGFRFLRALRAQVFSNLLSPPDGAVSRYLLTDSAISRLADCLAPRVREVPRFSDDDRFHTAGGFHGLWHDDPRRTPTVHLVPSVFPWLTVLKLEAPM